MEYRSYGKTDLKLGMLGVGLAEMGFALTLDDVDRATQVLEIALDHGINLIDTAACYGISEELVGRCVARRRDEYILSTKCGHVPDGYSGEEWTSETITDSVDRSLRLMGTDHLDILHLHSCSVEILTRGEVIEALKRAKENGKTRYIAYSGDNEAAEWAVKSGHFDGLQTSFSLVDQKARKSLLPAAARAGMGVIVKRPIANGVWQADESPSDYADGYFKRAVAMLAEGPLAVGWNETPEPVETALAYALSLPAVTSAIVGTTNPAHMLANIQYLTAIAEFPSEIIEELNRRFDRLGAQWPQLT